MLAAYLCGLIVYSLKKHKAIRFIKVACDLILTKSTIKMTIEKIAIPNQTQQSIRYLFIAVNVSCLQISYLSLLVVTVKLSA